MTRLWRWGLMLISSAALITSLGAWHAVNQADRRGADRQENVIEQAIASSVQLYAERQGGKRRAGSGVVAAVGADGSALILTAAHLIEPLVEQRVYFAGPGGSKNREARILYSDAKSDTAILEARGMNLPPVELQQTASLGDEVWVVSYPWGRHRTLVSGVVSRVADLPDQDTGGIEGPVRLIDAAVGYGTSGGGVFDRRTGALLGIVRGYRTAKLSFPGAGAESLDLPIAGETTVIPTDRILCVLQAARPMAQLTLLASGPDAGLHPGVDCRDG